MYYVRAKDDLEKFYNLWVDSPDMVVVFAGLAQNVP